MTTQFGSECPECGWRHQVDAFAVGERVRVSFDEDDPSNRLCWGYCHQGRHGKVIEWRFHDGAPWVRVELGAAHRPGALLCVEQVNFYPCQLEHA